VDSELLLTRVVANSSLALMLQLLRPSLEFNMSDLVAFLIFYFSSLTSMSALKHNIH
jgi:hypothetical protein